MTLQIAPIRIPDGKIAINRLSNKRLAEGAGLSLEVLTPDSESHLTFRVLMNFNPSDESVLFGKISIEIKDEWRNSSQLKSVTKKLIDGDDSQIIILQSFLLNNLEFYVEPQTGGVEFTLVYLGELKVGRKDLVAKKHHHDVKGWLVSNPD